MGELARQRNERKMARLRQVAELYREATRAGSSTPAKDIADRLGAYVGTVRTWILRARTEGLLDRAEHVPRVVPWHADSWRACRACKVEWPCKFAKDGDR